jgi:hypothetical protein
MKQTRKKIINLGTDEIRESILRSMIASFKIEKINIPENTAQEIYRRVRKKLKK